MVQYTKTLDREQLTHDDRKIFSTLITDLESMLKSQPSVATKTKILGDFIRLSKPVKEKLALYFNEDIENALKSKETAAHFKELLIRILNKSS